LNLARLVRLDKGPFVGRQQLVDEQRRGPKRRIVGLDVSWSAVEQLFDDVGMAPQVAAAASRVAVPIYKAGRQIGRATTTTWSPVLKKLIALATIDSPHDVDGTEVEFEVTVEAVHHRAPAVVVKTPFFNPARKTAQP
jgi:aminomethyltransferase